MNRFISIFVLSLIIIPVTSQAEGWLSGLFGSNEEGINVFEGGQQYVRIVQQEKSAEIENQHPQIISTTKLKDALSAIKVQKKDGLFSDEIREFSFFSQSEINILSSSLSRAFERAKPTEDVIFVVLGVHKYFFDKEQKVIGARAFIQDDKLNLVLGDVYRPKGGSLEQKRRNYAAGCGGCDTGDLRTNPYIVGSRNDEHKVKDLVFADIDGLEHPRSDWFVLEVDKIAKAVVKERNKLPPALAREQARSKKEAAKLSLERRQMREEMARMRKEMKGGGGSNSQSLEERLATLDSLKDKGLVSDKEYKMKRQEILNDL